MQADGGREGRQIGRAVLADGIEDVERPQDGPDLILRSQALDQLSFRYVKPALTVRQADGNRARSTPSMAAHTRFSTTTTIATRSPILSSPRVHVVGSEASSVNSDRSERWPQLAAQLGRLPVERHGQSEAPAQPKPAASIGMKPRAVTARRSPGRPARRG